MYYYLRLCKVIFYLNHNFLKFSIGDTVYINLSLSLYSILLFFLNICFFLSGARHNII